jgi:RimJ/RimL family protein N-acetyltransferase
VIPELRTKRLVLRGWTDADRPAYAAINADPAVMEFIGPVQTRAESDAHVVRMMTHWAEHGFGLWCVELDGACIGFAGLATPGFMPGVEVGWRLSSVQWGNGYAPEAARAAVDFGFGELGLDEIVSFTFVGNDRSRRVMDKLGMVRDPGADFEHPRAIEALRPHVLYRLHR